MRERREWTYADKADLKKYLDEGREVKEIAELMGRKRTAVVNAIERYFRPDSVLYKRRMKYKKYKKEEVIL